MYIKYRYWEQQETVTALTIWLQWSHHEALLDTAWLAHAGLWVCWPWHCRSGTAAFADHPLPAGGCLGGSQRLAAPGNLATPAPSSGPTFACLALPTRDSTSGQTAGREPAGRELADTVARCRTRFRADNHRAIVLQRSRFYQHTTRRHT